MNDEARPLTNRRLTTPRAAAVAGILFALLLSIGYSLWVTLIFPGWVLVISVYILALNLRGPVAGAEDGLSLMTE